VAVFRALDVGRCDVGNLLQDCDCESSAMRIGGQRGASLVLIEKGCQPCSNKDERRRQTRRGCERERQSAEQSERPGMAATVVGRRNVTWLKMLENNDTIHKKALCSPSERFGHTERAG